MARKNRVQPTENKQLFRKLKKQLKQKVKRAEARGYVFAEGFTDFEMPNRVTKKALEKLQNLIKNVYDFATYYDPITGRVVEGQERRKEENIIRSRKSAETKRKNKQKVDQFWLDESGEEWYDDYSDEYIESLPNESLTVLENLYDEIKRWSPEPNWSPQLQEIKRSDVDILENILLHEISLVGFDLVAKKIKDNAEELIRLAHEVMYQSGNKFRESGREAIRINMNRIAAILIGRPLNVFEAMNMENSNINFTEYE